MSKKIDRIRKHYVPRITPGRAHYDILDWAGADTQIARFEVLTKHVALTGKTLLDVGCGLGDLATFLQRKNIPVTYTGVDVVEEMLARAQCEHPKERFVRANVFDPNDETLAGEAFDVVFCSGTLNLNLGNNVEFLGQALSSMLRLTRERLVVNFLHICGDYTDPTYFHYDPNEVLTALTPLCCGENPQLIDNYLPNDFTVICEVQ